ncbi:MAG: hypothetical protein KA175_04245 [Flavobacteriales bacterium]|nr:hypothetical protein [Flavobacteriales bacterium]MBP6696803.1 hypothetical protein [Flavobacteriales bacterium]
MKVPLFIKHVLPFAAMYAMMVAAAILLDRGLHAVGLDHVGRYLGPVGTVLIVLSFVYSLRKRKIIPSGSPKTYLRVHEYLAWAGSVMILVHAGIHFNARLPWLATYMLLISVASGLVGKYLLKSAGHSLEERRQELIASGSTTPEVDKELFFDSVTVNAMKQWRVVHLPIAFTLGFLTLLHVITVLMFGK